jgi:phosphate transport system substrate-binding protein
VTASAKATVALALALLLGCAGREGQTRLDIRGSDSEVNVVQRLAEVFMKEQPDVFISVTGGGSGVGIAALIDGTADLANSSRPLRPEEKLLALRSGIRPYREIFALDALTIIVHEDNPVETLTLEQVGALFRGEVERWTALGGPDARVITYGRQTSSGTYQWFRENVVQGGYDPSTRQMSGTAQIVDSVARDPGGVGYVAVGYLEAGAEGVHAVAIQTSSSAAPVSPLDEEAVLAGRYPISRPLYQFSDGPPEGALADFVAFERSARGREIILAMGFFPPLPRMEDKGGHVF